MGSTILIIVLKQVVLFAMKKHKETGEEWAEGVLAKEVIVVTAVRATIIDDVQEDEYEEW